MPKYTVGLIAGIALVSASAAVAMAANGGSVAQQAATDHVQLQVGQVAPGSSGPAAAGQNGSGAQAGTASGVGGQAGAQAADVPGTAVSARGAVVRTVRTIKLDLPKSIQVGKTATGFLTVTDVAGKTSSPVTGVNVSLQGMRTVGNKPAWVDVQTGTTDGSGRMAVSFTAQLNSTWRAAYYPATGKPAYSPQLTTQVYAWVTWGARPDMDVQAKAATSYTLRITADSNPGGHLEYMLKGARTWTKLKSTALPASNLITQTLVFPKAGTYYVRGASDNTKSNAAGYTTTLTVVVH